ncbi:restriction endonuclease subunit S [Nitrosomonas oligotropha]|uniref:Type I restriction enzyme, S subunit n=1 Tax=Nitrosomonas oligotropha TaxID=42354 RepID=A0A1H8T4N8_9PROT|nr:restriction endonuclease subunit S [Nitrosomonas oligotropha]SDX21722.1 type I restriction enzyme, S subunit [Nitrosomonas oligotropha]SEO85917.1 type I restriction enzyme, S subunit [Nitrosomonas oligotropha]
MDDFVMGQVTELQLDRSDWQLVKFGDVAIQQKESVDRENTELTRYVKGEHMGSEDLHLREWGELTDEYLGPAFIRKFEQGDILYGSRRTYLRKVAIAHFDGITSNTTFVIKANEAKLDKRLLPFVMLSEGFAEHSIRNSKGSVNPYINWKDIADYEFLLPPKHQQAKLAELLWAMDEVVENELFLLNILKRSTQNFFENRVCEAHGEKVFLSEVLIPKNEKSAVPHMRDRYIGLENVESGAFFCTDFSDSSSAEAQCNCIDEGDLCYSKLRPYLDKAFIATFDAVSSTELLVYKTRHVSKAYVLHIFHSKSFINYISGKGFGTKMPRVNHKIIGEFSIKIIPDESDLLKEMARFQDLEFKLNVKLRNSKSLQKSLINQIF